MDFCMSQTRQMRSALHWRVYGMFAIEIDIFAKIGNATELRQCPFL